MISEQALVGSGAHGRKAGKMAHASLQSKTLENTLETEENTSDVVVDMAVGSLGSLCQERTTQHSGSPVIPPPHTQLSILKMSVTVRSHTHPRQRDLSSRCVVGAS
jgi:hypothetical protein